MGRQSNVPSAKLSQLQYFTSREHPVFKLALPGHTEEQSALNLLVLLAMAHVPLVTVQARRPV